MGISSRLEPIPSRSNLNLYSSDFIIQQNQIKTYLLTPFLLWHLKHSAMISYDVQEYKRQRWLKV